MVVVLAEGTTSSKSNNYSKGKLPLCFDLLLTMGSESGRDPADLIENQM